jgi:Protein of unknown function (DUF3617)
MRLHVGCSVAAVGFLFAGMVGAHAQSAPIPVKPGLWETQVSVSHVTALPPEAEAKIAALPAAQQAQVRSMMGGSAGGAPVVTTKQACIAAGATMDSMLNRAQQTPGMQCTFSNRVQTATGASFDMSCTMQQGSASGHTSFHLIDGDHVSSTSHMTVTGSSQGHTMNSTMDSTTSAKFVSADCGNVKPFTAPAVQ